MTDVKYAYRDAEGWVLSNDEDEALPWPEAWPDEIDAAFLEAHGVEVRI